MFLQFSKGEIKNYSSMNNLGSNYEAISQFHSKIKLHLEFKNARLKDLSLKEHYRWDSN